MHTAYIALGSNVGDRRANMQDGLRLLAQHADIRLLMVSTFLETTPVGGPAGQTAYLNAAAELCTRLLPRQLLEVLLDVERQLGRVRGERNQPRTLDLDLLLYDDLEFQDDDLTLPHPRMHERWFVLAPLAEIAPQLLHPTLRRTMRDLLGSVNADAASGGPIPAARELLGQTAVVTGATSGIGKAIALQLASAGANVIIHGRRPEAAAEVARLARQRQVQALVLLADLHSHQACARLVEEAFAAKWVRPSDIDIWINNAGADTLTGEAGRWPFDRKLQELLTVDVTGTMLLARAAGERMKGERMKGERMKGERMKGRGPGVIVNVGWDQADTGMEGDSGQLFAAAKAAIMAFSKSLALTLAPQVRVNCVAPGWIRTAWGETASQAWQDRAIREAPLARWGTPDDVAHTVRWLASPAAAFITGQVIRVNGGAVR